MISDQLIKNALHHEFGERIFDYSVIILGNGRKYYMIIRKESYQVGFREPKVMTKGNNSKSRELLFDRDLEIAKPASIYFNQYCKYNRMLCV